MPGIVAFSGSRDLDVSEGSAAEHILESELSALARGTTVIHGASGNVDLAVSRIARRLGLPVIRFPADWENHGRKAGPIRNNEMAKTKPVRWVVLWDGVSPGSSDALKKARACGAQIAEHVLARADEGIAPAAAKLRDEWIALGERISELTSELARRKRTRLLLDNPLFVRISDEPRKDRRATPEEVSQWKADADARVSGIEREIAALRALPTPPEQP